MSQVHSFGAVIGREPRVLILGSMPGIASLEQNQYYAHPRNAFWRIMGDLFGIDPGLPYAQRLRALSECEIALWDVLESCFRPGSLDSSIDNDTVRANDFATLFAGHPTIRYVFFNGGKAADVFRRRVVPGLDDGARAVVLHTLPSTSPAHAARSYEEKLTAWATVKEALESGARKTRS
ncbi:MAG: DNA-deoxyinosine glycosylase [Gammaproteobacteria bacterium]